MCDVLVTDEWTMDICTSSVAFTTDYLTGLECEYVGEGCDVIGVEGGKND